MAIRINYTVHSISPTPVEVDAEVAGLGSVRATVQRLTVEGLSEDGSMSHMFRIENSAENLARYAEGATFTLEDNAPYAAPVEKASAKEEIVVTDESA